MGSTKNRVSTQLVDYDAQVNALTAGRVKDPFSFLGAHNTQSGTEIRVYLPAALRVELLIDGQVISALRYKHSDLFIAELSSMPSSVYQCQVSYENSDVTFYDVLESCQTLQTFVEHEDSKSLIQGCKRVSNLLKQQDIIKLQSQDINVNYISEPQEQSLYEAMISQKQKLNVCMLEKDHKNVLQVLSTFKKPVDDFFEHVMVNVDDLRIRQNRLVMLAHLEKCFSQFAAFSLIQDA